MRPAIPTLGSPAAQPPEKFIVSAILAVGALARLVWTSSASQLRPVTTESHNVAVALAKTGRFADPFANGGGFTAHLSMLTPLPSAIAYRLFGVDTPAAEFALSIWAIVIVSLGFWLCWKIFCLLGTPAWVRIAAIAFVAVVPIQFGLETREGRSWEVNLAVLLLLWIVYRVMKADREQAPRTRPLVFTGALTGFLTIVNPPAGLAAAAALGLYVFLRLPPRRWWTAWLSCFLVLVLFCGVWAERNLIQLGQPVMLRDNFYLELALSNYSGALNSADPGEAYLARIHDIHPLAVGPGTEKLRAAGGEIAYYEMLGREVRHWIAAHPGAFACLSARRFMEFYLPPRWFWGTFGGGGKLVWLRQLLVWTTALLGLLSLLVMAIRERAYIYLLAVTLLCATPYIVVQPILRYRYLISSLLIFLAFDGIARASRYVATVRGSGALARSGEIMVMIPPRPE